MKRRVIIFIFIFASWSVLRSLSAVTVAIKDVVKISTQRENYLTGYGLVVGLPQTGDSKNPLAGQSLENLLRSSGVNMDAGRLAGKNTAAVMVMATLPPITRSGDLLDIWVASIGDAKSLSGGFLVETPLLGQDGKTYAIAQAGIPLKMSSQQSTKNSGTTLYVIRGATVEKTVNQPFLYDTKKIRLALRNFDIQNLNSIMKTIEKKFPGSVVISQDGLLELSVPDSMQPVEYLATVMSQPVEIKMQGKVVVDPHTGTIVSGSGIKISKVGITKNGITIKIQGQGSGSESLKKVSSAILEESTTVDDLVKGLNNMGLGAEEI
ncbi:MAG: flagellar basal body P-ring protein FlgI, partial [Spirochaetia bacterium]|nr:flagellar basal body P-ring protein FlgI [Spirochaetia bacterium]